MTRAAGSFCDHDREFTSSKSSENRHLENGGADNVAKIYQKPFVL